MTTAWLTWGWLFVMNITNQNAPQPRTEFARLVIYRQKEFGGSNYDIYVNDRRLSTLAPNRYLQLNLPPGRTKIGSRRNYINTDAQTLYLTLQPGRTYYVKAVEEVDFLTRTLLLAPVKDEQAQRELRRVKPQTPAAAEQRE